MSGKKRLINDPLAAVTRNNEEEFSDIINWVVQALYYGEEQGLTKDLSLCQNYTYTSHNVSELNFLNAVYCVGNYEEILFGGEQTDRDMNQINNGSSGMLYATPFGDLENKVEDIRESYGTTDDTFLEDVRKDGSLNCGVVIPDSFTGNITNSSGLVGMSVEYCSTLAAALFNGNVGAVKIFTYNEYDSFAALNNGTVDVLSGATVERKYDFESSILGGFRFSTPYYYGNETAL